MIGGSVSDVLEREGSDRIGTLVLTNGGALQLRDARGQAVRAAPMTEADREVLREITDGYRAACEADAGDLPALVAIGQRLADWLGGRLSLQAVLGRGIDALEIRVPADGEGEVYEDALLLLNAPWEALAFGEAREELVVWRRLGAPSEGGRRSRSRGPLSVLYSSASPRGHAPLGPGTRSGACLDALRDRMELAVEGTGTREGLRRWLRERVVDGKQVDVVHLSCHGRAAAPAEQRPKAVLALAEAEAGGIDAVDPRRLAVAIGEAPAGVGLVVLSACHAGGGLCGEPYAASLVALGAPASIGFAGRMLIADANAYNASLYEALAAGSAPIDALRAARRADRGARPPAGTWHRARLYIGPRTDPTEPLATGSRAPSKRHDFAARRALVGRLADLPASARRLFGIASAFPHPIPAAALHAIGPRTAADLQALCGAGLLQLAPDPAASDPTAAAAPHRCFELPNAIQGALPLGEQRQRDAYAAALPAIIDAWAADRTDLPHALARSIAWAALRIDDHHETLAQQAAAVLDLGSLTCATAKLAMRIAGALEGAGRTVGARLWNRIGAVQSDCGRPEEAERAWRRALSSGAPGERGRAILERARHHRARGAFEAARADLVRAIALVPRSDRRGRARALRERALMLELSGEIAEALRILRSEVLPALGGDASFDQVEAKRQIANLLFAQDDYDGALRILRDEVLPALDTSAGAYARARALAQVANILFMRGENDEALRILRGEVLFAFEETPRAPERTQALLQVANLLMMRGEGGEALRILRSEVLPVLDGPDRALERANAQSFVANALCATGSPREALQILCDEVLPAYDALGFASGRATALERIATLLVAGGDPDRALAILRSDVLPTLEAIGDRLRWWLAAGTIANALAARGAAGDLQQAIQIHRKKLPALRALGALPSVASTQLSLAQLLLRCGGDADRAEALALLEDALAVARRTTPLLESEIRTADPRGAASQRVMLPPWPYFRSRLPRAISVASASSFGSQKRRNRSSHASMSRSGPASTA